MIRLASPIHSYARAVCASAMTVALAAVVANERETPC